MLNYQILSFTFLFIVIVLIILILVYRFRLKVLYRKLNEFLDKLLSDTSDIQEKERITNPGEIASNQTWNIKHYIDYLDESINGFIKEISKNLGLMNLILDYVPHGILVIDGQRRILKINESLSNLFYLDKRNVIGSKTISVFNNKKFENLISRGFEKLVPQRESIIFFEDEDLYLDIEAIPVTSEGSIVKKEDVLEVKNDGKMDINLLILLKNTTQEMEFSRLRSQFVANVSHEMRTPLTSIKGYLETLLETGLKDERIIKNYLTKSLDEVKRLNLLIEDVLNLSKIEYKRNVLFGKEYNLVDIISDCIRSLYFLAKQNNIDIEFSYDKKPLNYITDGELFGQMVKNIIENSIFYAGSGTKIKVSLEESRNNIVLNFTDNGAGISKKDLPYIFQRFYRGKGPYSSKRIGSGLGLSIVKHIVELHNGKINVTSIPDVETRFSIILPK